MPSTLIGHRGVRSDITKLMNLGFPGVLARLRFPLGLPARFPVALARLGRAYVSHGPLAAWRHEFECSS